MSQKITNIGELRDKVTFTRLETTSDGMGGVTAEDKTICTEWAFVTVPSTRDGVVGGADAEYRSHVVRVRQNTTTLGIDINDKATWRNWTLTVKGVRPDGHEWIDFDCVVVDK
jgi:head-tail adaptor